MPFSVEMPGDRASSRNRTAVLSHTIASAGSLLYTDSSADPAVLAEDDFALLVWMLICRVPMRRFGPPRRRRQAHQ